jgi:hypothetical protein
MDKTTALLIPIDARKKSNGIPHFFEHLLLNELRMNPPSLVYGYTTEDYIILYGDNLRHSVSIKRIENMQFGSSAIASEKIFMSKEIRKAKDSIDEKFFTKVWGNTIYEESPLGKLKQIESITKGDLIQFRNEILKRPVYFYYENGSLHEVNRLTARPGTYREKFEIMKNREMSFNNKCYIVCFLKGDAGEIYMVSKILTLKNPRKHIQLSVKKKMMALILEGGIQFPGDQEIEVLKEEAYDEIKEIAVEIDKSFVERATKELESKYFYNVSWSYRIKKIFAIPTSRIISILNNLHKKQNEV